MLKGIIELKKVIAACTQLYKLLCWSVCWSLLTWRTRVMAIGLFIYLKGLQLWLIQKELAKHQNHWFQNILSVCWILLDISSIWLRRVRKHNLTLIWKYCTALLCIIAWKSLNNLKNLDYLGLLGQISVVQLINWCCNTKKGKSSALWSWIVNNDVKIKIWYILRFP